MGFDIAKYDVGNGWGCTSGDGKLTGAEVQRARKAGYLVWEGYNSQDGIPERQLMIAFKAWRHDNIKNTYDKKDPYTAINVFEDTKEKLNRTNNPFTNKEPNKERKQDNTISNKK